MFFYIFLCLSCQHKTGFLEHFLFTIYFVRQVRSFVPPCAAFTTAVRGLWMHCGIQGVFSTKWLQILVPSYLQSDKMHSLLRLTAFS